MIMTVAYTVTDRQISGGPDWINTDRWNIEAKAERRGTSDELHDALAHLLENRFKLKLHRETRDLPAYLLTVDKKGLKMRYTMRRIWSTSPSADASRMANSTWRARMWR